MLLRMDQRNVNQMPVEQEGRLLGLLRRENLLHYVRTRAELGMLQVAGWKRLQVGKLQVTSWDTDKTPVPT